MDWLRSRLADRLDRIFFVVAALCVPLALALAKVKSYTVINEFGQTVHTRAHPRYGSFGKVLVTLLLVVAAARALIFAIDWVRRGSSPSRD